MESTIQPLKRDTLELANDFEAPANAVEEKLVEIWSRAFNVEGLGVEDDFFDLGGNSMIALRITNAISEAFGVPMKAGKIVQHSTVRSIAEIVGESRPVALPNNLIAVREDGDRPPLFLIHGAAGIVFPHPDFLAGFHPDQPVYAFQIKGFDGKDEPLDSVEAIAEDYTRSMLDVYPSGPWYIAAYCAGSWIAVEMARIMERDAVHPSRLILIDPGIQRGRMRERFETRHGMTASLMRRILPSSLLEKADLHGNVAKLRCFLATGYWCDYRGPAALDNPKIKEWVLDRRGGELLSEFKIGKKVEDELPVQFEESRHIVLASAKLKHAFYTYDNTDQLNQWTDLIVSKARARELENPNHPLNTVFPNRRIIITGDTHADAVASRSPTNSRIIQGMMDSDGSNE